MKKIVSMIVFSIFLLLLIGAINCFAKTFQEQVEFLTKQAVFYSKNNGDNSLALMYINKAIKLQPHNFNLYYNRAFIMGRAGEYHNAIKEFSRFVKNDKFPHAVRFRADCFMAINQMQRAVHDYKCFLKLAPKDGKVWSYLVETLALMGKQSAALSAINHGLESKSHWSGRLKLLQKQIAFGEKIIPHMPFSN
jgi:tetratricopeptide (TPR) repeat protein